MLEIFYEDLGTSEMKIDWLPETHRKSIDKVIAEDIFTHTR